MRRAPPSGRTTTRLPGRFGGRVRHPSADELLRSARRRRREPPPRSDGDSAALGISRFARLIDGGGDDEGWFEGGDSDGDYGASPRADADGGARTASSRFWGVHWNRRNKKWKAYYTDTDGKKRSVGYFDDEEEAARAHDQAIATRASKASAT